MSKQKRCMCFPTPEETHFVHYGAREPGSMWEYNPYCPEHGDHQRWRITCCNWPHRDAPHFAVWMEGEGIYTKYTYTFAEAWAYINAVAPLVQRQLAEKAVQR